MEWVMSHVAHFTNPLLDVIADTGVAGVFREAP